MLPFAALHLLGLKSIDGMLRFFTDPRPVPLLATLVAGLVLLTIGLVVPLWLVGLLFLWSILLAFLGCGLALPFPFLHYRLRTLKLPALASRPAELPGGWAIKFLRRTSS